MIASSCPLVCVRVGFLQLKLVLETIRAKTRMWCPGCQQDIPAISTNDGGYCCARCGGIAGRIAVEPAELPLGAIADCGIDLAAQDPVPETPAALLSAWKIDDELRKAQQTLRSAPPWNSEPAALTTESVAHRFDPPQIDLQPWQQAQARSAYSTSTEGHRSNSSDLKQPRGSVLAWSAQVSSGVCLRTHGRCQRPLT